LLTAHAIHKSFDGVRALRGASLDLGGGEVHALVGENGAGKSTLIRILTGALQSDDGRVELEGELLAGHSPARAKALGIAAIYQQPALWPELTVAENIALPLEPPRAWRRVDWKGRRRLAAELLGRVGAEIAPEAPASGLSMPQQQLVEIARALGAHARVLIMDEPTASLSEREAQNLFRVIAQLRRDGRAILYITHRLDELPSLADRVTVLRDGETVATRPMPDVNRQELIRLMVGRELGAVAPKHRALPGDTVLALRDLGCRDAGVGGVTLELRGGEILGLAGLVGAGRTGLARILFGLEPADSGMLRIRGTKVHIRSPRDAMDLGLAYLPEDRRRHGVIAEMPVSANLTLAALRSLARFGFLDARRERELAARFVQQLEIKAPSLAAPVATLSGGNQQKVALGRWLATRPSVLILDEPTQGIDVGAKTEIHALIAQLAAEGVAVLMISSELPEILALSDRIAVMRGGRIVGILDRSEASQSAILELALHG